MCHVAGAACGSCHRNEGSFFQKRGHSLKAMTMISQINQAFGIEVPLRVIFESPVIEAISDYIIRQKESGLVHAYSEIEAVKERAYYPVSSAQKRMYVVSSLEDSGTSYNLPGFILIEGELNVPLLQSAFRQFVERHETLRTRFEAVDGEPVQIIEEHAQLHVLYSEADESETERLTEAFVRPFELNAAPLFRVELVKLKENKHLLLYDMHHIISDGVSAGIVVKEFVELLSRHKPGAAARSVQGLRGVAAGAARLSSIEGAGAILAESVFRRAAGA
jgi:hypothetical protein